ncbi:hypothetical protein PQO03_08315 [Lentisphaera profundi]|uniref:HTTM domain-containing protein n=1 Tax=Lentisphaera profundi TaxID=1658616 RepID=A0ABY7VNL5_9BACT|nr:hypothetical protein [Lentisphaera profundi]WDE95718.1 hypothetical protein PQO03_08315 [Lentisphaera profundi]
MNKDDNKLILLLKLGMATYLFSRGMLYLTFDSPLRALLWSETIVSPFVHFLGMTWQDYANVSDYLARILEKSVGLYFIFVAGLCLWVKNGAVSLWQKRVFHVLAYFTALHILLKYLSHGHEIPILLEYVLQGFSPFIFLAFMQKNPGEGQDKKLHLSSYKIMATRTLISACFIGHGLYAAGWPYQSVKFVRMLTSTLFIDFDLAAAIVQGIGIIDIMLGVLVFIKAFEQVSLAHMAFWGFLTAFSRVVSQVLVPWDWSQWHLWTLETSVRLIHGILPLFLFFYLRNRYQEKEEKVSVSLWAWQTFKVSQVFFAKTAILILTFSLGVKVFYSPEPAIVNSNLAMNNSQGQGQGQLQKGASENSYCDEIFSEAGFQVRLKLAQDKSFEEGDLDFLKESKQEVLNQLKNKIIQDFHESSFANESFDNKKILGFAKNVQVIYGDLGRIEFKAKVPWREQGEMSGELSEHFGSL